MIAGEVLVRGLSHITFVVKDLERSSLFFEKIFNAKEIYSSGKDTFSLSEEKFFLVNDLWVCIMKGEALVERTYNHVAFQVQDSEFDEYML